MSRYRKKKVLILCRESAHMGGVVNYIDSVMKHYESEALAVERFTIGKRPGNDSNAFYLLLCMYDFSRFFLKLFDQDYKLVHLNPSLGKAAVARDSVFLLIAKLHFRSILVFWHGWDHDFQKTIDKNTTLQRLLRFTFGRADTSIVLASTFKKKLEEWKFPKKITVDTTTFDESLNDGFTPDTKRKEMQGSGKLIFLFMARLDQSKGIIEAIEAFSCLHDTKRQLEFLIAGNGPDYELVKQHVEQCDDKRIKLLGYVRGPDKRKILEKSHIMLLPTYYGEGLPVCLLEAMAFGMPIITTPIGGIPDNFTDGHNGYYLQNVTSKSLTDLLRKTISDGDTLAQIAANNFSMAKRRFPASVVSQRLETIYRQTNSG